MGAHETSCRNPYWLALEVLVRHHLLETSAPGSPHLALKSESSVPVAEADKVVSAAELAKLAEQSEEDEEYYLRSRLAWMQAETEPVTDRPLAVEHSARLHTHRYELRPRWPRLRSSMTVEQLADACVVLEELHQNFDDADWLWEQITVDIHKQFEALRDAYSRHRVRVLNGREPVRTHSWSLGTWAHARCFMPARVRPHRQWHFTSAHLRVPGAAELEMKRGSGLVTGIHVTAVPQ